ncbi:kelch-like protein 14 isoform X2 [Lethenteron reissneri]|uniref:kelch-like protein 14 isoform X2 n=1 Tax=Lethenteron reissneri TaxID=7753 RepID=UPI002AB7D043|nr:kelch-like protein 14 isoform X2 [Lethenteron reissneri]
MCDALLMARGVSFPAHRLVLAAASSYCRSFFSRPPPALNDVSSSIRKSSSSSSYSSSINSSIHSSSSQTSAPSQASTTLPSSPPPTSTLLQPPSPPPMNNEQITIMEIHGVTPVGLERVLDFIYSGRMRLSMDEMEDILTASNSLLMRDAVKLCLQYLGANLRRDNCAAVLALAHKFGSSELRRRAVRLVARNLRGAMECGRSRAHLLRVDVRTMQELLAHGGACGTSETELLHVATAWLRAEPDMSSTSSSSSSSSSFSSSSSSTSSSSSSTSSSSTSSSSSPSRMEIHAADLLDCVRFALVAPSELKELLSRVPAMSRDARCRDHLQEALRYHGRPYAQPLLQTPSTSPRGARLNVLALGGRSGDNGVRGEVWASQVQEEDEIVDDDDGGGGDDGGGDDDDGGGGGAGGLRGGHRRAAWRKLCDTPVPVYNHCAVPLGGFVFVLGGQHRFEPRGTSATNQVFRLDPRSCSWLEVAPMRECRTRFVACALNGAILAVAGGNLLGEASSSAERYNPAANTWEALRALSRPLADHAGALHRGTLFVSGGYSGGRVLGDVTSYIPRLGQWLGHRPLCRPRCEHAMASTGERVYCLGGRALDQAGAWVSVLEVECYSAGSDQWSVLQGPRLERCQFGAAVTRPGRVLVLGGGSLAELRKEASVVALDGLRTGGGEEEEERAAAVVQAEEPLPLPLVDHACCLVELAPAHRDRFAGGPMKDPNAALLNGGE